MHEYTYLIIGGGMAADAAAQGIRQEDADGSLGIISAEPDPPYNRPPLSKGLWQGMKEKFIWRDAESKGATLHLSTTATSLDPEHHLVTDDNGDEYRYQRLLLATGGTLIRLPESPEGILYFRTYQDYRRLRELADSREAFTVIGGGFIGSEIAAALTSLGKQITMIFPESGIGGRVFPAEVSDFLTGYYRDKGVSVMTEELVEKVTASGSAYRIALRSGHTVNADVVVAGLGIRPNVDLAQSAGLQVDDGIRVDASLQTSHPDIFAAGDVANFYNPVLDSYLRVEHEENANQQGLAAGINMAGGSESYHTLPSFYSDLFDLSYEAVGETKSDMDIVQDWKTEFREGVIYYLRDGRVRGVAVWGIWQQMDPARALIAEKGPFREADLQGRLPVE